MYKGNRSMNGKIKGIVFDMDGVLVDTERVYCEQLAAYLIQVGGCSSLEVLKKGIGASGKEYMEVIQKVKPEGMTMEEFQEGYRAYYEKYPIHYSQIAEPGICSLLERLKVCGMKLAVASSSGMKQIQTVLGECGINGYFDEIVSGEIFEKSKPDPSIYLEVIKRLGLSREETAVVEDSVYGIRAAKEAGAGIIFQKWNAFYPMPEEEGCRRIEQLKEICYSLFGGPVYEEKDTKAGTADE